MLSTVWNQLFPKDPVEEALLKLMNEKLLPHLPSREQFDISHQLDEVRNPEVVCAC